MPEKPRPHETRDIHLGSLTVVSVAIILFIALTMKILGLVYPTGATWPPPGRSAEGNSVSPAFTTEPETELAALRAENTAALDRAGLVEGEPGFAHIPVEAAMQIIAERGLPHWGQEAATDRCDFLTSAVPRSPQAAGCRREATP